MWAGKGFEQVTLNYCPCITHARGKSGGFLLMKRGFFKRWTTVRELAKLQGSDLDYLDVSCVKKQQLGGMIGNAMSRNVLDRLVPRLLFAIGCLNQLPTDPWVTKS